jgi:hypothetical protein
MSALGPGCVKTSFAGYRWVRGEPFRAQIRSMWSTAARIRGVRRAEWSAAPGGRKILGFSHSLGRDLPFASSSTTGRSRPEPGTHDAEARGLFYPVRVGGTLWGRK